MNKRIVAIVSCAAIALSLAGCGGSKKADLGSVPRLSPDMIISVEDAAATNGGTMELSQAGVVQEGKMLTATYVGVPLGSVDTVSVSIEQFSDSLPTSQVWADYENERINRSDAELIQGIGQDCYIEYPFICVYDRGCFIKISAGSGSNEGQKNTLIGLATTAAAKLEQYITPEQAEAASDNVIR